jgi:hypothetical protein
MWAETVARAGRGYDAGKKVNGRKRHIAGDTFGLLLVVAVSAASVQDRPRRRTRHRFQTPFPVGWELASVGRYA